MKKNKMNKNIFLGTLVVLMTLVAMPSAMAANTFYLDPQDSTGMINGSIYVDLKLDVDTLTTGNFGSYQANIVFNDSIVNIPDSEVTLLWGSLKSAATTGNTISIAGLDLTGSGVGTYTLATMRLDGLSEIGISDLTFDYTELNDLAPLPIDHVTINGTYTNQAPPTEIADLVVTNIDPYQAIFVDATNVFTVHVKNQGIADVTGSFDVYWEINDSSTVLANGTETITGLNIGEEKTFDFNWMPTVLQDTHVTATVDYEGAIVESDDNNNTLTVTYVSGTGILPLSDWGYGGDEPLTNYKSGEVVGDLIYTFGDSAYLGGYNNPWSTYTVNFDLVNDINQISDSTIGGIGNVKEARLYMYYNWYRTPLGWPEDPEEKLTMTFDGNPISTDAKYEDSAGFGYYGDYKYGTFVYNVTSSVTGDGTYQAVLTNDNTGDTHGTGVYGMALLVIYEDSAGYLKEYHIAEGHDLLKQYYKKSSTGRYGYHVLPEDATSTFTMPEASLSTAKLFTVTHDAKSSPDKSRLNFNAEWWSDPWTTIFGNTGTDIEDVSSLKGNPNTVAFQDRGDGYVATNAILISMNDSLINLGPIQDTEIGRHIMIPITAHDLKQFYGTVEMDLNYDAAKFTVLEVYSSPDSVVTVYDDDSGILDISAWNQNGVKGDVVLATVELEVIGGAGSSDELTLIVDLFEDIYGDPIDYSLASTTISIANTGELQVTSAEAIPQSALADLIGAILNDNGRLRHTGDDQVVISAYVADSGLGIMSVTVDLSDIGGNANTPMSETPSGTYTVTATATDGIGETHKFVVTATDNGGNTATATTTSLTVYRRGDVNGNNKVDMGDALYIAKYTVGSQDVDPDHFKFVGDTQPADGGDLHTTNMGDALYIARYTVGLEPAP